MKASQAEAEYARSQDPAVSCGTCEHYMGEGACEVVGGDISPEGVSVYWEARVSAVTMSAVDRLAVKLTGVP